ncbi:hypothetical protein ACLK1S_00575 [Escherichia coli]
MYDSRLLWLTFGLAAIGFIMVTWRHAHRATLNRRSVLLRVA